MAEVAPSGQPKPSRVVEEQMSTHRVDWKGGHTRKDLDAGMRELEGQVAQCRKTYAEHKLAALGQDLLLLGFILGEVILVCLELKRPKA